ncbi:FAD-binding oxidoreductase [Candidatus Saccharibacteria bacterium]|nr:FAD-binding oxidoreductase [Candidatus Saccharibacteria bacterium]
MNKIAIYLNRHLSGNVFDKDSILESYATDRSPLKIKPRFVALPESTSDVRKLVRFVSQLAEKKYSLPISVRGSGLSKTGADLSSGLVLSTEKMDRVRELDAHDRLVHVQAGISLEKLNAVLAPHGLTLPVSADPKTTIGSLISEAPLDKFSKKYGGIMNYVDRVEVVLSSGDILQTSRLSRGKLAAKKRDKGLEGDIYEKLDKTLIDRAEFLKTVSDSSRLGYPALKHIRRLNGKVFDLLPAFFGAEGSLGVITEVILRAEPLPPRPHRLFAVFSTFKSAQEFAEYAQKLSPLSVELFDMRIFKTSDKFGKKPDLLTRKLEDGFLVLASFNDKSRLSRKKVRKCVNFLPKSAYVVPETLKNSADFEDFAAALASFLNDEAKGERLNLLHDFFVPPEKLASFLQSVKTLEASSKTSLELFGSFSTGIYSFRPDFELEKVDARRAALTLLRDLNDVLKQHDGSLVGGLPEGRLKSIIIYPDLSKKEKDLFSKVKKIFDPNGIFAPEIKTNYNVRSTVRHLRTEPNSGIIS